MKEIVKILYFQHKYPIGSGRVTFNNAKSYMKAVAAAFIEIKTQVKSSTIRYPYKKFEKTRSHCGQRFLFNFGKPFFFKKKYV